MAAKKKAASHRPRRRTQGHNPADAPDDPNQADSRAPAPPEPPPEVPVVGIAASAGALDAFGKFLGATPADCGVAFVLLPHLDPTHPSLMAELLSQRTPMTVCEAADGMLCEPNRVYVIPPNGDLSISAGRLRLTRPEVRHDAPTAIDFFFRSLAHDRHERAIGVVLSGTGRSGTPGLKAIKLVGGLVLAQRPDTAEYAQMPQSVIAAGLADAVLPPEEMPAALIQYLQHPRVPHAENASTEVVESEPLSQILAILRTRTRYDFRGYRRSMLARRVERRMTVSGVPSLAHYIERLQADPAEVQKLYKDLLIGVTDFFRDPDAFDFLATDVIPTILDQQRDEVRVWVPGCASGEEAYSIAILFLEEFARRHELPRVKIFATDVDDDSLEIARRGMYSEEIAARVSLERRQQFFVRVDLSGFQVDKPLRDAVVFARQNVISDPPFRKVDLISCRNLLIYLEPETQERIIATFHFALRPQGFLLLGPSESAGRKANLFEHVSRKHRVYRRVSEAELELNRPPERPERLPELGAPLPQLMLRHRGRTLATQAQQLVMDRYAPPCVVINRNGEVVYLHGPLNDFLQVPGGELTSDLLAMAREGLQTRLRSAVRQAVREERTVVIPDVSVKTDHTTIVVQLTVEPVREPHGIDGLLLVSFERTPAERPPAAGTPVAPQAPPAAISQVSPGRSPEQMLGDLEYELKSTREELQATIEELESSNEELRASHEEALAVNQELQSSNEELETSKEEYQSVNEELGTVNMQLQQKVDELDRANAAITNLFNSTDIATIFLDGELRIQRFTPGIMRLFNLQEGDVGRPITDLATKFNNHNLAADCRSVLQSLIPVEREVTTLAAESRPASETASTTGPGREPRMSPAATPLPARPASGFYLCRITPYQTARNHTVGVVITFVDVAQLKRVEESLRESEERMRAVVATAADAIITIGERGEIDRFNPAAERMFGYSAEEAIGRNVKMLMPSPFQEEHDDYLANYLRTGRARIIGIGREVVGRRKDGSVFPIELSISELQDGTQRLFTGSVRDITERKELQQELLTIASEEQQRIGQDLHDQVGQALTGLSLLAGSLSRNIRQHAPQDADLAARVAAGIDAALDQTRALAKGLIPVEVDAEGLMAALADFAEHTTDDSGIKCTFHCAAPVRVEDKMKATHLYRITQEAVTNALRHAACRHIRIRLEQDKQFIILSIRDDGKGISDGKSPPKGMGRRIMQYRAGLIGATLSVNPGASGGTLVTCTLPVSPHAHS